MKKLFAGVLSLAMVGTITACGSSENSSSESDSGSSAATSSSSFVYIGDKTIGISMPAQELKRWNSDGEFLKNQFETAGYKVDLKYSNNDPIQQGEDIKQMIEDEVDLLLIAPVNATSLADTLSEAKEAEIPVVAYDRLITNSDAVTYYISYDNYEVGKLQAKYIKEKFDLDNTSATYNIEFVGGDAADNNARCFFEGAYKELKPYIEMGKLNIPSGKTKFEQVATQDWATDKAEENMTAVLTENYSDGANLDAVICANDSTALGVTNAYEAFKPDGTYPVITGQDGDVENLKNIVDGKQAMIVYKNVNDESQVAFEVCNAIIGKGIPASALAQSLSVEVNYDTDTYSNGTRAVQSFLLYPETISKDNLNRLVDTGNYVWDAENKYLELKK